MKDAPITLSIQREDLNRQDYTHVKRLNTCPGKTDDSNSQVDSVLITIIGQFIPVSAGDGRL